MLLQKKVRQPQLNVAMGHLPDGIYQLQLTIPQEGIFSYRFQKMAK